MTSPAVWHVAFMQVPGLAEKLVAAGRLTTSAISSANGCAQVETGVIHGSVHYLVQDQPDAVADLIERHASSHLE